MVHAHSSSSSPARFHAIRSVCTQGDAADARPVFETDEEAIRQLADGFLATYTPIFEQTLRHLSELRQSHVELLGTMSEEDAKLLALPHYQSVATSMGKVPGYLQKMHQLQRDMASIQSRVAALHRRALRMQVNRCPV